MNQLAIAYARIDNLLQNQEGHNLSCEDVAALKNAQKAILVIETLGLELSDNKV